MKSYIAFCKKEWLENIRTYKLFIMLVVFVLLGVMKPMMALLLPQILNGADLGGGIVLNLPDPVAMDSWTQFYSNIGQIGLIVLTIVFSGLTANEFTKDTLINMITKGIKRRTIIASKFTVASLIWTASYLLSVGITWAYTAFYFDAMPMSHPFIALASIWLYGMMLLTLMLLGGVLFKSFYGSLLLTGGIAMILMLLNINPDMQRYNPVSLADRGIGVLMGTTSLGDFMPAVYIGIVVTVVAYALTVVVFNRKQL